MNRIPERFCHRNLRFALATVLALSIFSLAGLAATPADAVSTNLDAHAEIAAVLYAASATQAALTKSTDQRLRKQQERIDVLAAELKAGDTRHRAQMIAAQDAFVTELAAKDREYAAQIGVFRNAVTDIASTPQGIKALERFNAGDEVGAIDILDRLRATNESMRAARAKLEDAADARRIASLALEAKLRGKLTTTAVIKRFEEVVRLDPGVTSDWLQLGRLYQDAGRLADARRAVDAMTATAHGDSELASAFAERSDVLLAQGDLLGARAASERALDVSRRVSGADPKNLEMQFTLSRALVSFGEVARRQGDLDAAQMAYVEEIGIARRRVAADPKNLRTRLILGSDLLHLADVLIQRGDIRAARVALEENLAIQRSVAAEVPDNIVYPRQIAVTLMWLSDVLVSQGALGDARAANAEIVKTATRLAEADPGNAVLLRDLTFGYSKTALLQRIEGDFEASLKTFEQALKISRDLAGASSASLDVKQDVGTGLTDVAGVKLLLKDFEGARHAAEEGAVILRNLAAADPTDATSRQFLATALCTLGTALTVQADYERARKAYEEAMAEDKTLAAKNADAADIQRDLSSGLLGLGKLRMAQGDPAGAASSLEQSLQMRRRAAARLQSSTAQRDLAEVMRAFLDLPASPVTWTEFRLQLESMDKAGILWPADRPWLIEAQRQASAGARP